MRGKCFNHAVLGSVLALTAWPCLSAEPSSSKEATKYLDAVREFADNVLKYGRDTYGPKHTPLFVDGLMIYDPNDPNYGKDGVFKPVEWIAPNGDRWVLSNLASQQNLFRVLDGLTKITGDPKYKQAAMDAIRYAFDNLRSPNGLLYWGSDHVYDAAADKPCGGGLHEFKGFLPYYKLMWEVNPQATKQFIEAFWSAHIMNWSNLEMNRCALLSESLEIPWKHEYEGGPVFFESWGFSPMNTGSDLCYAAAMLNMLSGEKEPLVWGKRLVHRYIETRNPKTGFTTPVFTVLRGWRIQAPSNDKILSKLGPMPFIFPGYANRARLECHFGYDTPTPGTFLNGFTAIWICQLKLGDLLGDQGTEFTQWAAEELTAWGKIAYRSRDNVFIPMFLDGTSLEGYVCKEDGPLGFKGNVLEPVTVGPTEFWAYVLAYFQTDNEFMWEMARNIAFGNNYGDLGISVTGESRLNLQTDLADPYVIIAFLELYRKTNKRVFLEMARRIGDNVLTHRFHEGFFAPERHTFAKFDSIDSLALLHLHTVLIGNKGVNMPRIWPGTSFYEGRYRSKDPIDDNQLIYSLKDVPEPPISLQEAAADGNVEVVKSMIAQGIGVDGREDGFHKTALHRAAISGHKDVVALLLAKGADIDAKDYSLISALHYAVEYGHKNIVELLLANGADVNAKNNNGQTPVDIAISRNCKDIVELLIANGADVSLHTAVRFGDLVIVKSLIEKGADINAKDASGRTVLHYAVEKGHKDIVELLIANGANVNARDKDGDTPAHIALGENNISMLALLIEKGANLDSIHLAARKGDLDRVKIFIEKGADVNATDSYGATPLHYAAAGGSKGVVKFLIARCVDVNVKTKSGDTPLHKAAISGHKDVVKLLIDNAANVNATGQDNYTPLHYAVWSWDAETAALLIEKGADVDAKDRWGWTPLHHAANGDNRGMALTLIVKGDADVNAQDNSGETALSVAKEKGRTEIVELLRKHGAKER